MWFEYICSPIASAMPLPCTAGWTDTQSTLVLAPNRATLHQGPSSDLQLLSTTKGIIDGMVLGLCPSNLWTILDVALSNIYPGYISIFPMPYSHLPQRYRFLTVPFCWDCTRRLAAFIHSTEFSIKVGRNEKVQQYSYNHRRSIPRREQTRT
jgi:hypothetical protein